MVTVAAATEVTPYVVMAAARALADNELERADVRADEEVTALVVVMVYVTVVSSSDRRRRRDALLMAMADVGTPATAATAATKVI